MFEGLRSKLCAGEVIKVGQWGNDNVKFSEFVRLNLVAAAFVGGAEDFRARCYEYYAFNTAFANINEKSGFEINQPMVDFYRDSLFMHSKVALNIAQISGIYNGKPLYKFSQKSIRDYVTKLQRCAANTTALTQIVFYACCGRQNTQDPKPHSKLFMLALHCMEEFGIDLKLKLKLKSIELFRNLMRPNCALSESAMQFIVDKVLDRNVVNSHDSTLLHIAANAGSGVAVTVLLQHSDIDANKINLSGSAPLASALRSKCSAATVALLHAYNRKFPLGEIVNIAIKEAKKSCYSDDEFNECIGAIQEELTSRGDERSKAMLSTFASRL